MVIHALVVISFNKILPSLKANEVKSANLRASWFVLYLLSTSCVLTLASSTFSSCSFLETLLLLSSYRREGFHPELPGVRGLLGCRLPVDVPVAPASEFRTCFTLPHTLYKTFVIYVINNIRTHFIISFYVICAVIYCSFYCIYV